VKPIPVAVRRVVEAGDLAEAARLLGRPFEIEGVVVEGDRRGQLLGFPTANLEVVVDQLLPPKGIYAGAALGHRAAVSIGVNPQFGGTVLRVEAHLLDFDGELYGRTLVLELWQRLRDELAFAGEAELIEAIAADVEATRRAVRP
jgi:riboflavin kinase/FMN adenylyltransferase